MGLETRIWASRPGFGPQDWDFKGDVEQVAQGQYVVSDTRCPALSDCELEWEGAGQRPRRGRSPVEHRGILFIHSFSCLFVYFSGI